MASYNVSSLSTFVDEQRVPLIAKTVLGAKTASYFDLMTGVKGPVALNRLATTVVFGNGAACGWNDAGEATLSQRNLVPAHLKVNMQICDKVLLNKWAAYQVKVEANKTDRDLPFEEEFLDSLIANVKYGVEKMIWQGDSTSQSQVEFDGIIKTASAQGSTVVTSTSAYGTTAYAFVKAVAAKLPFVTDDTVIFVSTAVYREFMQDLVTANLYHYDPAQGDNEYKLPGTNISVIGVEGLDGTSTYDYAFAGSKSNFVYGVNLEDGDEIFDLWYSKDNRAFRVAIEFTAGVQYAWPEEVVMGTRAKTAPIGG